jgi:hypothetical protein
MVSNEDLRPGGCKKHTEERFELDIFISVVT